jgi:hypothetical protein
MRVRFLQLLKERELLEERELLVLGASTAGLLGSPFGQGPILMASALFPGRTVPSPDTSRRIRQKERGLPVFAASTAGLLGSPFGQGPILTASALSPVSTIKLSLKPTVEDLILDSLQNPPIRELGSPQKWNEELRQKHLEDLEALRRATRGEPEEPLSWWEILLIGVVIVYFVLKAMGKIPSEPDK